MSGGFAKLFSSIVHSSVWSESDTTRIVWVTMLALADCEGVVEASVPGLARAAVVSRERLEEALAVLSAPDPDDRSGVKAGRRIEAVQGGWRIVNYRSYRERGRSAERREYLREKKRQSRARGSHKGSEASGQPESTSVNLFQPIAEAQADAEAEDGSERPSFALPESLETGAFRAAWADWLAYRRERKLSAWRQRTVVAKLDELASVGADRAVAAIRRSISNGWSGIFPEPERSRARPLVSISPARHSAEDLAALEKRVRRSDP